MKQPSLRHAPFPASPSQTILRIPIKPEPMVHPASFKHRFHQVLAVAAFGMGSTLLWSASATAADGKTTLDSADARFVQDEVTSGHALVRAAEIGVKHAKREDVKALARMIVEDHGRANEELAGLAKQKGVELEPIAEAKLHEDLEETSGDDFDEEFLDLVIDDHREDVKEFEKVSREAADGDLKAWAGKRLPGLRSHLEKAEELNASFSKSDSDDNKPTAAANKPADNSAVNMRDRDATTLTPIDQGNSKADIETTAQIRREILEIEGLSVNAQNVKIITNGGKVTLRGPVDSEVEKRIIGEVAMRVATADHTDNQIEIAKPEPAN